MEQAIWIAEKNEFDMENIKLWSLKEGMDEKFTTFKAQYEKIMTANKVVK